METLTKAEISERMTTALAVVHNLYEELNSFLELVRDSLIQSELGIRIIRNKRFILRDPSLKARSTGGGCMALDLGFIGELDADEGEDEEDVDKADGGDEEDDGVNERKGHKVVEGSRFLVLHVRLLDDTKEADVQVEPTCYVGLIEPLVRENKHGGEKGGKSAATFQVPRRFILRNINYIDDSVVDGGEIIQKIPRYRLRGSIKTVKRYPLAQFGDEGSVHGLIEDIVAMCNE